jgi:hypothetical protein
MTRYLDLLPVGTFLTWKVGTSDETLVLAHSAKSQVLLRANDRSDRPRRDRRTNDVDITIPLPCFHHGIT